MEIIEYVFGIDVGGTAIKFGLFSVDGTLLEKWELPTNTAEGGRFILPDIAQSLKAKQKERNIALSEIRGAGIGVPGPVLEDGMVDHCVNLGWGKKCVPEELTALTGFPIKVANDANAAALGEVWKGSGRGFSDVLLVTIGTGIGGGLILHGNIVTGVHGSGAEIGHICVNPHETVVCGCGNYGCLEQYTSATAILRIAKERLAEGKEHSVLQECKNLTTKDVIDAAKNGDALALDVLDHMAKTLGRALANCCALTDVALIIIGGGVSKAGLFLLEPIQKYYRMYAFHTQKNTCFQLAELGNDAGIYGAACLMI